MTPEWRPVVGYEGIYEVSSCGSVRSLDRAIPYKSSGQRANIKGRTLTPIKNKAGYLRVNLCVDGKRRAKYLHQIVAEAFLDNPYGLCSINHKDENKANNCVDNLEWCDSRYNDNYGSRNERISANRANKGGRSVTAMNPDTGEEKTYPSIRSAERSGYSRSTISWILGNQTCKRTGKQRMYRGLVWRDKNDDARRKSA